MQPLPVSVTVVINTLNEEANLPYALRSVQGWAAEIVVCDMHSDDATVAIARSYGARVCLHERLGFADPARAFALAQARHDWVLVLDADELIPPALARRLAAVVAEASCDICWIPRLNYLLGAVLPGMGWGPDEDAQMRLFRRSAVEVTGQIHHFFQARPGARQRWLRYVDDGGIVHFNYVDLSHFLAKLNTYTTIEAVEARQRGRRSSLPWALLVSMRREWWGRWLRGGGFRLGWRGLQLTVMMTIYRFMVQAKLAELQAGISAEGVRRSYRQEAERWLAD
ncbi:glycosyltransferase family 2 protein [Synechococcus sp. Tobar12-5m-g]|uniref:glycosyltransferase family 2 protein n=1 Tax=unclassified Synechococcus TaxID=2626047 RepID=UPI0020CE1C66|nr:MULTISPECIES: glycosyltransferase family 2 protein [unclassified Synechococcus]MCP9772344.1 glycosyltransferase family 2 protein [Synechococcus sp. Tobar12-5m-g]MCP9873286.1 glycosyltransferase family 2 protein [Synechococcus sp. Cruz CV-v-12]